jgi:hypothetical protein
MGQINLLCSSKRHGYDRRLWAKFPSVALLNENFCVACPKHLGNTDYNAALDLDFLAAKPTTMHWTFTFPPPQAECLSFIAAHIQAPGLRRRAPRRWMGLGATLLAGLRAALLLSPKPPASAPPALIVLLLSLAVAAQFLLDGLMAGWSGEWFPEAWPAFFFPALLCLIAAALAAEGPCFAASLALLLALALPIEFLERLRWHGINAGLAPAWLEADSAALIAPVWFALTAALALARLAPAQGVRRWLRAILLAPLLAAAWIEIPRGDAPWGLDSEALDAAHGEELMQEGVFYRQAELLENALAQLRPGRPRQVDLYFLSLGGDAGAAVFMREASAARQLMNERFGAQGRSLVLANHYGDAADYPIASVTSLRRSLHKIASVMDKDQDILFLFLTSHGSPDHQLALEFWPLRFEPLNPQVLRALLDEIGIRWRVLVISACYSGGFITDLQNEDSIIITAAAPDRASFGCSNENDWTYFGGAFFDQALREESDLERAFALAQAAIAAREEAEQEIHSEPRIAAGAGMRKKWADYLASLHNARASGRHP